MNITLGIVAFVWSLIVVGTVYTPEPIQTEIIINGKPDKIWQTLMDFEAYPEWNPFIKNLKGEQKVGANLEATIGLDELPMQFKPVVLKLTERKEFRWLGKLGMKGLFDGEHYFILEKTDGGTTTFVHGETFSGLLSGILLAFVRDSTVKGFNKMNQALKNRVEGKALLM